MKFNLKSVTCLTIPIRLLSASTNEAIDNLSIESWHSTR